MNAKESEQMALLKFSVIAPLVNQTYGEASKSAYFRKMAAESYQLPDGRVIQYSRNTISIGFRITLMAVWMPCASGRVEMLASHAF
jgi:hypothetical protein